MTTLQANAADEASWASNPLAMHSGDQTPEHTDPNGEVREARRRSLHLPACNDPISAWTLGPPRQEHKSTQWPVVGGLGNAQRLFSEFGIVAKLRGACTALPSARKRASVEERRWAGVSPSEVGMSRKRTPSKRMRIMSGAWEVAHADAGCSVLGWWSAAGTLQSFGLVGVLLAGRLIRMLTQELVSDWDRSRIHWRESRSSKL